MAVSIAQADALLGGLPGTLYVQVHSGDPGANGTANVVAGVSRGTVTIPAASGGQRAASAQVDCPGVPAGASVSWVSYWDAVSGGTFKFSVPLAGSVTFAYAGTLRFTSEVFTVTTTTGGSQTQTSITADATTGAEANVTRLIVVVGDTTTQTDAAGAFTGSGASDATTSSDSSAIRLGVVVADTTGQSNTASGNSGAVSDTTDTTTASDSNTASEATAGPVLVPNNPSFETDITATTEQTGAWWKNVPTGFAGRHASATMTGSYVGRVYAAGYFDGEGDVADTALLAYKFLPADFADGKESITFDVRHVSSAGTPSFFLRILAYENTTPIISAINSKDIALIAGADTVAGDNTTLRVASPVADTTYSGKTMNLKTWVEGRLDAGKTWANVTKVVITFTAYATGDGHAADWYVDNFR